MAGSVIACSQELEGRDERRVVKSENRVDPSNVAKLVGIGEVLAVPSDEEIAPMIRGQRQVQRISERISWHHVVLDVGLNDFENGRVHGDDGER
jgi:hypothetical protein